jgi:DnaK suppressor protein
VLAEGSCLEEKMLLTAPRIENPDHLQKLLDIERQETLSHMTTLASELEALFEPDGPIEVQFDDESGEGAGTSVDLDRGRVLLAQLRKKLEEIDEAQGRLEGGSYGVCDTCGLPISPERLEAVPTARSCVRCKTGGLLARVSHH